MRTLLRRRWGITFQASSKAGRTNGRRNNNTRVKKNNEETAPGSPSLSAAAGGMSNCNSKEAEVVSAASEGTAAANPWCESGSVRWTFDVNHRHGIFEGNTLLNFAGKWKSGGGWCLNSM